MGAKQLVVTERSDGSRTLDAVDRTLGDHPWDYEDDEAGTHVPRLGTQDLLAVGIELEDLGYKVTSVDVRDMRLSALDEESEDFWNDQILKAIRQHIASDPQFLESLVREVVVVGLSVRRPSSPFRLTIRRGGEVQPQPQGFDDTYLGDLREVWKHGAIA
ncbi:hypothetical protein [Nocardioides sp. Iso805N]|uniref:hypothetical protein n=1 Tax=Nocardioides sp. Iso805N TaxID=1283287 RepID=UPI000373688A|nr:hypothetical protein [Nocardioides sp. Iso805N]